MPMAAAIPLELEPAPGSVPGPIFPVEPKLSPTVVSPEPRLTLLLELPGLKTDVKFVRVPPTVALDERAAMPLPPPILRLPLPVVPDGPPKEPVALPLPPPSDAPTLPVLSPEPARWERYP